MTHENSIEAARTSAETPESLAWGSRRRAGRRRFGARRWLLMTSTAIAAGAAFASLPSGPAAAACTPTSVYSNQTNLTFNINPDVSNGFDTVTNSTIQFLGTGTFGNDCVVDLKNSSDNTIVIDVVATTTFGDAIVLDDSSTGNIVNVTSALGGTATAVLDGAGANTVNIAPGANITAAIQMGAGTDKVTMSGGTVSSTIDLGAGNDLAIIQYEAWSAGGMPVFDGGADTDDLDFDIGGGNSVTFNAGNFTDVHFKNFENLYKAGDGTLGITAAVGGSSFETVTVQGGELRFVGLWTITNGALNLHPGTTAIVGNGVDPTTVVAESATIAGSLGVVNGAVMTVNGETFVTSSGSILVTGTGIYNAIGATTINLDGKLDVIASGHFNATGPVTLNGGTGGRIKVNAAFFTAAGDVTINGGTVTVDSGSVFQVGGAFLQTDGLVIVQTAVFNAQTTTTVTGGELRVTGNATYVATGNVEVSGGGVINVYNSVFNANAGTAVLGGELNVAFLGTYHANGAVLVSGGSLDVTNGVFNAGDTSTFSGGTTRVGPAGTYNATGAVTVSGAGALNIAGGIFNALDTTTLDGAGAITVGGGAYTGTGLVLLQGNARISVTAGAFESLGSTNVAGSAAILVLGGSYTSNGLLFTQQNGTITVNGGTLNAKAATTLTGSSFIAIEAGAIVATGPVTLHDSSAIFVRGGTFTAQSSTTLNLLSTLSVIGNGVFEAGGTIQLNGGTVTGTGSITGGQTLVNAGGRLVPGSDDGPSVLKFAGTYNQLAAGTFVAPIYSAGGNRFDVTGTASLDGALVVYFFNADNPAYQQIRVLSTDAPLATMFSSGVQDGIGAGKVVVWAGRVNDAGIFDPVNGNNVDLIVAPAPTALEGLTPNQQAVANYLGKALPAGQVLIEADIPLVLFQIAVGGPNALDQVGGEVYDSFTTFAFDTARRYGGLIDDRVRSLRCAAASGGTNPLCGGGTLLAEAQIADAGPGAPGAAAPRGFSPNTHPYGWSVWASGIGSYLSKDRTSTNLGYSGWTSGAVFGVDLALSKRWIVGVMVGGSKSNIDFSGVGGDGDLSNLGVGVYTAWYGSRWFADASFAYSKNWIEAKRNLQFGTVNEVAKGTTDGDQLTAHATVGYGFSFRKVALEVSGGVDWTRLSQDAFTETGAGALNLSVASRTDSSLRFRVGLRAARPFLVRPGLMVVPEARIGYARELLDNTRPVTSSLSPIPGSFTVNGDDGSRNVLTFGVGVKAEFSQGVTVSLNYNGEWAGDRQIHGIQGRLHIRW